MYLISFLLLLHVTLLVCVFLLYAFFVSLICSINNHYSELLTWYGQQNKTLYGLNGFYLF